MKSFGKKVRIKITIKNTLLRVVFMFAICRLIEEKIGDVVL